MEVIASLLEAESGKLATPFEFRLDERRVQAFFIRIDRLDAAENFVDERWARFAVIGAALFATQSAVADGLTVTHTAPWLAVAAAGVEPEEIAEILRVGSHNEGAPGEFDQFVDESRRLLSRDSFAAMMARLDRVRTEHQRQQGPRVPRVRAALAMIRRICPFRVRYADSASLRGVFLEHRTEVQSREIEAIIMSVNPEAADVVDPAPLRVSIRQTDQFALWWD